MFGTGYRAGCAVKCNFHTVYLLLTLNDQVIKNSATVSPASLIPTDRATKDCASPLLTAFSITALNAAPSLQVNLVLPVAFFIYCESTRTTSIDMAGLRL